MDKLLELLGTTLGRSFIIGVFLAMSIAIVGLSRHVAVQGDKLQHLNDRLIEAEKLYRAESEARWRADIERSNSILQRLQDVEFKKMKRKK